jgi:hypothetical protein
VHKKVDRPTVNEWKSKQTTSKQTNDLNKQLQYKQTSLMQCTIQALLLFVFVSYQFSPKMYVTSRQKEKNTKSNVSIIFISNGSFWVILACRDDTKYPFATRNTQLGYLWKQCFCFSIQISIHNKWEPSDFDRTTETIMDHLIELFNNGTIQAS